MGTKLAVAAMLLVVVCAGAQANETFAETSSTAMPLLAWNETDQQLIAHVPPEVQAWMEGELADEDGRYASWKERFDAARSRPEFAQALGTLQDILRQQSAERGLGRFEIENALLPTLLRERPDLARALAGEGTVMPMGKPRCYVVQDGEWYCPVYSKSGWWCAVDWACNTAADDDACSETKPIPCPENVNDNSGNLEIGWQ